RALTWCRSARTPLTSAPERASEVMRSSHDWGMIRTDQEGSNLRQCEGGSERAGEAARCDESRLRTRGRIYFRMRGCPWVRMKEPYGTPEFWRRYAELLAKAEAGELKASSRDAPKPGTWRWLCVQFFGSETGLLAMDPGTQTVRRLVLEATWAGPI